MLEKIKNYLELRKFQKSNLHFLTVAADLIISSAFLKKLGYTKEVGFKKYILDERIYVDYTLKKDNEDTNNSIESYILKECQSVASNKSIDFKELVNLCKSHGFHSFATPRSKSLNTDVYKADLRLVKEVLSYYGFNIKSLDKNSLNYNLYIEQFRKNFKGKVFSE